MLNLEKVSEEQLTGLKKIIFVMGPTACGKTDLAISLVQRLPCDIISVDSAMVYRDMSIGTAKPSIQELALAPHRLIDLCDASESYSTGRFCEDALREIENIIAENRIPILAGGTMLYFNKLQNGFAQLPRADSVLRQEILEEAEKIGWALMHEKLAAVDPVAANKIKPQDPQRIQRALEVYHLTGKPISQLQQETNQSYLEKDDCINIALIPEDRAWLHARIAKRFELMLDAGLVEEVRTFYNRSDITADLPAMRMVGYRQVWEYLDGQYDYETMKARAIAATRQLAKRQLTWLRSWKGLTVFDPRDPDLYEKVLKLVSDA